MQTTNVEQLKINRLTQAQYDAAKRAGTLEDDELYLTPEAPAESGVTSFNGRDGDVEPQSGDYTADMVGARADDWMPTAAQVGADASGTATSEVSAHNSNASAHSSLFSAKQDTISDLSTIRSGAALGATALQSFTETDPVFAASAAHGISSSDISNWNGKGTYSKPSSGIPKTDLASAVQTSLGRADSALQSFTETDPTVPSWAKQQSKPSYTYSEVGAEQSGAVNTHNSSSSAHSSLFNAKISDPASKSSGQVLTWNGSAWVAQNASGGMTGTQYTATIPSSAWTQSGDYFTNTVAVSGIKASYPISPTVDCSLSGTDADADKAVLEAFGSLAFIDTAANSITVKAIGAAPEVNIPIIINVWE